VLEGDDERTLRQLGDAIVPELTALGPDVVSNAEDGVQESKKYIEPRAGLFMDRKDLEKMKEDVDARWDWEVRQATDTAFDDDDAPPPMNKKEFEKRFEDKIKGKAGSRKLD